MSVCVFLGPTLDRAAARAVWDAPHYLPPVRQGDLYAAARRGPRAIGIVDGYFKGVPAVWHKEILWAMSEGIHVFGASSMGALRAAELDAFGMQGIGEVYASLQRGEWEDDDEVAVVHAPAELGYGALSEAMVNIRATLAAATAQGVVDRASARRLLDLAKARHYTERGFSQLLEDAVDLDPAVRRSFADWLPTGRVDQKAADAVSLIGVLRDRFSAPVAPLRAGFRFEHTEAWQQVVERSAAPPPAGSAAALALEAIKLDGSWRTHARAALLRGVLAAASERESQTFGSAHLASTRDMLRRAHGLWRAESLADWKSANGLDDRDHDDLLESEARVQHAASTRSLDADVVKELQVRGDYARYLAEAERVRDVLNAVDADWHERSANALAPSLHELLAEAGIACDPNELPAYASGSGFADVAALRRALLHRHRARAASGETGRGTSPEPRDEEPRAAPEDDA